MVPSISTLRRLNLCIARLAEHCAHPRHCIIRCQKHRVRDSNSKSKRAAAKCGQPPKLSTGGAALGPTGEARIRRRDISKLLMHSNIFETNTHHIAQYAESAWTSGEEKQSQLLTEVP